MNKNKAKQAGLKRRQRRVRGKIFGTPERPRLRVVRTNANIYAMIVNDNEGKTLVSTLAGYLNAIAGKGVHIVTVNDYLAKRDSEWMGRLYRYMGMLSLIHI